MCTMKAAVGNNGSPDLALGDHARCQSQTMEPFSGESLSFVQYLPSKQAITGSNPLPRSNSSEIHTTAYIQAWVEVVS
jgi:hypothetical protein